MGSGGSDTVERYPVAGMATTLFPSSKSTATSNIGSIGPNLVLSADARPSDGQFSLVTAGEEHRDELADYLEDLIDGRRDHRPFLKSQQVRHVTLEGATDIHIDDEALSTSPTGMVSIAVEAGAVELLAL